MAKKRSIKVKNLEISVIVVNGEEFFCLTDMVSDYESGLDIIKNRLRAKSTISFLGVWEKLNNQSFNSVEFDLIRMEAGENKFTLSVKGWIEKTNAIGIIAKPGRYGGTYAHKDIALEFAMAISPEFKLYLIKEYERLKASESNQNNLERKVNRILAKSNYSIQTDAVKAYIVPKSTLPKSKHRLHYVEEADMLNVIIFGFTKKEWAEANPKLAKQKLNPRDVASINENLVLSRIEVINAELIKQGKEVEERFDYLKDIAQDMLNDLNATDFIKSIKRDNGMTYVDIDGDLSDFNKKLKQGLAHNPRD